VHLGVTLCSAAALALAACGSGGSPTSNATPTPTPTPHPQPATLTPTAPSPPDACAVTGQAPPSGDISANFPIALAFAPDGRLFYAERSGAIRVWQNGAAQTFASVSTVNRESGGGNSERGLLGLAISPTFTSDHYVFAFYSDADYSHQHVIRWRDCGGTGMEGVVIITVPSGSDCCHKGGRLVFGSDSKLYVTLGEEHTASSAQDTGDPRGKVLRYNPDGSIPADNPFGAGNPVWAYGFRNPFGIAVNQANGQMAVTNNGPTGDAGSPSTGYDTLIESVTRGAHYQWPLCYGYSHLLLAASCGTSIPPDWSSEQGTVVPTGAAFVDAAGPSGFAGHLVFCTLNKGMLIVTPGSPHASVSSGPSGCKLDVKEGPDHALFFTDLTTIHRMA
jgi:glucose/arabinose dehydrogenase